MGAYERHETIRDTIRARVEGPARMFTYERRPNENDGTWLHTIFPSRPFKAMELSTMTEDELLKLREFFTHTIDEAMVTVRELDAAARVRLKEEGVPSKRLYRPDTRLLIFPEDGSPPIEWSPDVEHDTDDDFHPDDPGPQ
jgi:hypothetical protein